MAKMAKNDTFVSFLAILCEHEYVPFYFYLDDDTIFAGLRKCKNSQKNDDFSSFLTDPLTKSGPTASGGGPQRQPSQKWSKMVNFDHFWSFLTHLLSESGPTASGFEQIWQARPFGLPCDPDIFGRFPGSKRVVLG